jgi:hypothetical protein
LAVAAVAMKNFEGCFEEKIAELVDVQAECRDANSQNRKGFDSFVVGLR